MKVGIQNVYMIKRFTLSHFYLLSNSFLDARLLLLYYQMKLNFIRYAQSVGIIIYLTAKDVPELIE